MACSINKALAVRVCDRVALTLKAETETQGRSPVRIIIALDVSGSMAGTAMMEAKKAVLTFLRRAVTDVLVPMQSLDLVLFNHTAQRQDLTKCSLDEIEKTMAKVQASGGTNFDIALECITTSVTSAAKQKVKDDYFVVFFTDGCDGSSPTALQAAMHTFKIALVDRNLRCEVHTLGFTASHDAKLLSALTRSGTVEGTFQYIKNATQELEQALGTLSEVLCCTACSVTLRLPGNVKYNVALQRDDSMEALGMPAEAGLLGTTALQGTAWIMGELGHEVEVEMPNGVIKVAVEEVAPSQGELLALSTQFVQQRVVELIDLVSNGGMDREMLRKLQDHDVAALKVLLADLTTSVMRMKSVDRARYRGGIVESQQLVNHFCTDVLTPALTGTLSNERIATLNALAYQHITKNRLKTRLSKFAANNVDMLEGLDIKIKEAAAAIDFDELESNAGVVSEYGSCGLSTLNYIEALRDCDCLCLGLVVERPEAAIAEPALVVVKSICPTVMTAEAFLDAVQFALGDDYHSPEAVHGGFGRGVDASVVVGTAHEPITAVMPLFINQSHWTVASQKMKPLMGWMCTLNVMGFSYDQIKKVPYLVLAHAVADAAESPSEFRTRMVRWVGDTAMAVYRQSPSILKELQGEEAGQSPISYLAQPLARTVDVWPSTAVFLMQLLCAVQAGDIKLTAKDCFRLWHLVTEEELRRHRAGAAGADDQLAVDVLLTGLLVRPLAQSVLEPFVRRAADMTGASAPVTDEEIEKAVWDVHFTAELDANHPALAAQRDAYCKRVAWIGALVDAVERAATGEVAPKAALPEYHVKVQAAILAQNVRAQRNADRRAQVSEGLYLCPFTHPKNILGREVIRLVTAEVRRASGAAHAGRVAAETDAMAHDFAMASSELSAAAAIRGFKLGSHMHALVAAVCMPDVPLAWEKLRMLSAGSYGTIDLRTDKDWNFGKAWLPGHSTLHRFLEVHHGSVTQEQAVAAFPHLERNINIWYTKEEPCGFLPRAAGKKH